MQIRAISGGTGLDQGMSLAKSGSASSGQASAASTAATAGAPTGSSAVTRPASSSGTGSSALSQTKYDVKDTNQDGYVSALEWLIYMLTHPGAASETPAVKASTDGSADKTDSLSAYNRQGNASDGPTQTQPLIDLLA
jgi:hypothetical protein